MKVCKNCRQNIDDEATVCPYCRENPDVMKQQGGNFYNSPSYQGGNDSRSNDRSPEAGMCIVSFLFPIVGIIYYIVNHNNEPTASSAYLKWSVISIVLCIVSYAILVGCSTVALMSDYSY